MSVIAPYSSFQSATLTLTDAQVRSLSSSPQTLIPAQGANTVIIPLSITFDLNYVSSFTGGGSKIFVRMTSSNKLWQTSMLDTTQTGDLFASGFIGSLGNYKTTSSYANQAVTVTAGANYTGGTGSQLVINCIFYVVSV